VRVLFIIKDVIAYERVGIMALSAILKKNGHEVRLLVISASEESIVKETLQQFSPHVIGYSAMTGEHFALLDINRVLKKDFHFLAVFGGPHATFLPQLIEEDGVDAICIGEGDESFLDFCQRVENGQDYWNTPSFHVKHDGKIIKNQLRPLVFDLNTLPLPDRKIIYDADPNMRNLRTKSFFAGRGCPYQCSYCFNRQYNELYKDKGKTIRNLSPERVVEEVEGVRDHYPLAHVSFCDSIFLLKPRAWLDEFCALYKRRVALPFSIEVRPNSVKEQDIAQLRDVGLRYVWLGVECGDEKVANEVLRRNLTNDQIITATKIFHRYGVKIIALNMMGMPVPNAFEADLQTIDLNIKIRPTFASCGLLYPYPGTDIRKYSREKGYLQGPQAFLESCKRTSIFTFLSPREKRKIENLQKLGGIITRFPILRPAAEFLSSLPFSRFYAVLFYMWLGYCIKVKIDPMKSIRKELPALVRLFRQLLAKS